MTGNIALERGAEAEANAPVRISTTQANAAPAPLISSHKRENDEGYAGVLARLNDRLRVIEGTCGLQWLLQVRKSATRWETVAFCGTRTGLILRIKEHLQRSFHKEARSIIPLEELVELHCDAGAWAIISGLPDCYRPHRDAQAADTAM